LTVFYLNRPEILQNIEILPKNLAKKTFFGKKNMAIHLPKIKNCAENQNFFQTSKFLPIKHLFWTKKMAKLG